MTWWSRSGARGRMRRFVDISIDASPFLCLGRRLVCGTERHPTLCLNPWQMELGSCPAGSAESWGPARGKLQSEQMERKWGGSHREGNPAQLLHQRLPLPLEVMGAIDGGQSICKAVGKRGRLSKKYTRYICLYARERKSTIIRPDRLGNVF